MKQRFTDEQIIATIKEQEADEKTAMYVGGMRCRAGLADTSLSGQRDAGELNHVHRRTRYAKDNSFKQPLPDRQFGKTKSAEFQL
jgi:hypothetical protein